MVLFKDGPKKKKILTSNINSCPAIKEVSLMNIDLELQKLMNGLISGTKLASKIKFLPRWEPPQKLMLLLVGYNGANNTGADVRVEEIVRQFNHIFEQDFIEITVITFDKSKTKNYFKGAKQVYMPTVFPLKLIEMCTKSHGVIAVEGSMFKSKFADSLSVFMASALGLANSQGKLSVGYGAEAGSMTNALTKFVSSHCSQSLVLARNHNSGKLLKKLGIRVQEGTDTAWTFQPSSPNKAKALLKSKGWDGKKQVLTICPINPYWWPVKPDLVKSGLKHVLRKSFETHYKSIYFHSYSSCDKSHYRSYLKSIAKAVNRFNSENDIFVVLVAMESLDLKACKELNDFLFEEAPIFEGGAFDMYDLVAVLRQSSYLISSRYHAIVTSMPAGVPAIGLSMDERIENLLIDSGHNDLLIKIGEQNIAEKILLKLSILENKRDDIRKSFLKFVGKNLEIMNQMGMNLVNELIRVYPAFLHSSGDLVPRSEKTSNCLPPIPPELEKLLTQNTQGEGAEC